MKKILTILVTLNYIVICGYVYFFSDAPSFIAMFGILFMFNLLLFMSIFDREIHLSKLVLSQLSTQTIVGIFLFIVTVMQSDYNIVRYDRYVSADIHKDYFLSKSKKFFADNPDYELSDRGNFKLHSEDVLSLINVKKPLKKKSTPQCSCKD